MMSCPPTSRSSIVFGTMIVILAFLPLFALGGMEGRLFTPLGLAYILAVIASLLVAVTVTPALCVSLLARRAAGRLLRLGHHLVGAGHTGQAREGELLLGREGLFGLCRRGRRGGRGRLRLRRRVSFWGFFLCFFLGWLLGFAITRC